MFKRIEIGDDGSATAVPNELRGALMRPELKATAQSFAEKIQAATPNPNARESNPTTGQTNQVRSSLTAARRAGA